MTIMKKKIDIEKLIGIILLIPPLISVLLFTINLFSSDAGSISTMNNLSHSWTGEYSGVHYNRGHFECCGSGGYTSSAPIYLGLMAIAGAILVRKK